MEQKQLDHHQIHFESSKLPQINLFLEPIDSPANLGSIFRNAEAFGVESIWINESNRMYIESTRFKRTSRSTWKYLNINYYENYQSVLKAFSGTKIGLEITSNSKNLNLLNRTEFEQVLLVLGNERSGISEDIIHQLDYIFHITMFGKNSSLNVSQTLGIALYELRR